MTIEIAPLHGADRGEWEGLARGYKAFYRDDIPDEDYEDIVEGWNSSYFGSLREFYEEG